MLNNEGNAYLLNEYFMNLNHRKTSNKSGNNSFDKNRLNKRNNLYDMDLNSNNSFNKMNSNFILNCPINKTGVKCNNIKEIQVNFPLIEIKNIFLSKDNTQKIINPINDTSFMDKIIFIQKNVKGFLFKLKLRNIITLIKYVSMILFKIIIYKIKKYIRINRDRLSKNSFASKKSAKKNNKNNTMRTSTKVNHPFKIEIKNEIKNKKIGKIKTEKNDKNSKKTKIETNNNQKTYKNNAEKIKKLHLDKKINNSNKPNHILIKDKFTAYNNIYNIYNNV